MSVIGVGEMGRRHVRVLCALRDRFDVAGVVDTNLAAARETAARHSVPCLADEAEAIARAQIVVIATPIEAHAAQVAHALEAGRHVLVEKPVCARLSDAERLVAIARRRRAHLFVGHSERHNPVIRALARLLVPKDVRRLDLHRVGPPLTRGRLDDGGVLLNLGIHDIDLAAYLAGSPAELLHAEGDDARATLMLSTPHGAAAHIYVDRVAPARQRTVRVTTDRATYEGDLLAPRLVVRVAGRPAEEVPLERGEPLAEQARALHAALRADASCAPSIASGLDGARALAIAERALHLCALPASLRSRAEATTAAEKL